MTRFKVLHSELWAILISVYREHAQLPQAAVTETDAESFASEDDLILELARLWKLER